MAPAIVIAVWWALISPKPAIELARPIRLALEFLVFGASALALGSTGHWALAVVFAVTTAVSGTLNYVWGGSQAVRFAP